MSHHGFLHPATVDPTAALAPLVSDRLARNEPVLAVLPPPIAHGLRAHLPATELTDLHTADAGELCRHPGRVLGRYQNWIDDMRPEGGPVTIITAPALDGGDAHHAALWMHIDAFATVVLAECDLTLICVYPDDPETGGMVREAHPCLLNGKIIPNSEHLSAEEFLARYPLPPPLELGEPTITETLEHLGQLSRLRQIVTSYAVRAGLPPDHSGDFVLAVSEVASNALEHGAAPATVKLWTTPTSVICEVTDVGELTQPLAGLLQPPTTQHRGRGLWLAYQLCDQLYLWRHPTTIRLQMDRHCGGERP